MIEIFGRMPRVRATDHGRKNTLLSNIVGFACVFPLQGPPWPNGQGVGLLIRRLRVRVPQGVLFECVSCGVCLCDILPGAGIIRAY